MTAPRRAEDQHRALAEQLLWPRGTPILLSYESREAVDRIAAALAARPAPLTDRESFALEQAAVVLGGTAHARLVDRLEHYNDPHHPVGCEEVVATLERLARS